MFLMIVTARRCETGCRDSYSDACPVGYGRWRINYKEPTADECPLGGRERTRVKVTCMAMIERYLELKYGDPRAAPKPKNSRLSCNTSFPAVWLPTVPGDGE